MTRKPRSAYNYLARAADKKRGELLGMTFPTAQSRMQKALLFKLAGDVVSCYRCKQPITDIVEFSIDHKESWQKAQDPIEAFFNLENVTFSHIKCNMSAGGKMCGGVNHFKTNLTEDNVRDIRKRRASGESLKELSNEFGINKSGISAIANRRTWKSVE